jgi:tetratricopeptide (TPR) repeat protein
MLTMLSTFALFGQTTKEIQEAFASSYVAESKKDYESAIQLMKKVYREDSYEINLRLGWLCYENMQSTISIDYYHKAVKLMPASTEPLWGLAYPLYALEKWSELEKNYQDILQLDPKNTTANYRLGIIYYYRKDYIKASKYFDVCLNLSPFDYDAMLMSAWNHYFMGHAKEAAILFNKVLMNRPGDSSALDGLGLLK